MKDVFHHADGFFRVEARHREDVEAFRGLRGGEVGRGAHLLRLVAQSLEGVSGSVNIVCDFLRRHAEGRRDLRHGGIKFFSDRYGVSGESGSGGPGAGQSCARRFHRGSKPPAYDG